LGVVEEAVGQLPVDTLMKEQKEQGCTGSLSVRRIKRQYVWAKSGGICWYCGAQLYSRAEADTEVKKKFIFTADHLHPRKYGGRGRANKVPACKHCNSHKSSQSVEEFRQWVRARIFDNSAKVNNQVLGRWKINNGTVVFYFELAEANKVTRSTMAIEPVTNANRKT
jgi:hypothetical protein